MADRAKKVIGGSLAGATLAALAMAVAALQTDEGKRNVDYLDIARIPTACYGHTGAGVKVGTRRSDSECERLLTADAQKHINGVLLCTPALAYHPYQLAAATRFAFNAGQSAYCGSTVARRFNAEDYRGGCDALLAWNKARVNGKLVVVKGLADRRARERVMCLTDL